MLTSGDIVDLDLGVPEGREASFVHPAVVVTSQRILAGSASVVHVVPLTTTIRPFGSEVIIEPDSQNALASRSAAQCQHVRSISIARVRDARGNVGAVALTQIRATIAVLLDLPM